MISESVSHFGITLKLKTRDYNLNRENYVVSSNKGTMGKNRSYIQALKDNNQKIIDSYSKIYADKEGLIYKEEWCKKQTANALINYDLNMDFFKKLSISKFDDELTKFLTTTEFFEITDLSKFSCSGYYAMVLGEYCQIYIGTSNNICRRIKQHWSGGKMKLDRLICGHVDKSKLSIDSFRALDTTRIFVYPTENLYNMENKYIAGFSDEFICNRLNGGLMKFGEIEVAANVKFREFE